MPRKTDVATEAKDNSRGDSASIDVRSSLPYKSPRLMSIGPHVTKIHSDSTSERCTTAKYERPKGCRPRVVEGWDSIYKLPLFYEAGKLIKWERGWVEGSANDHAKLHGRKTIAPKDILEAMRIMEFDDFLPRLEAELESGDALITGSLEFNEATTEKRAATRKAAKDKDKQPGTRSDGEQLRNDDDTDSPRAAKKLRTAGSGALDASQAIPSRGWGDSESEINEDEDVIEDEEDVGVSDVEEEEAELDKDEDEVESLEEEQPAAEDEALDNGYDSD
ncbi:hypothetical protein RUND412_011321 [Rhizina undulata]